jgi:hypothetical protein
VGKQLIANIFRAKLGLKKNFPIFAVPYPWDQRGGLAQLVEHRTENPCVPGSSPGSTTTLEMKSPSFWRAFFCPLNPDSF